MGLGKVLIEPERRRVASQRLLVPPQIGKGQAEVARARSVIRLKPDRLPERRAGFLESSLMSQL
jgi:hypothetical protein